MFYPLSLLHFCRWPFTKISSTTHDIIASAAASDLVLKILWSVDPSEVKCTCSNCNDTQTTQTIKITCFERVETQIML